MLKGGALRDDTNKITLETTADTTVQKESKSHFFGIIWAEYQSRVHAQKMLLICFIFLEITAKKLQMESEVIQRLPEVIQSYRHQIKILNNYVFSVLTDHFHVDILSRLFTLSYSRILFLQSLKTNFPLRKQRIHFSLFQKFEEAFQWLKG